MKGRRVKSKFLSVLSVMLHFKDAQWRMILLAALVVTMMGFGARAAVVADLATDWSNTSNPNTGVYGTWSYNSGNVALSYTTSWAGDGSLSGWAPTDNAFTPFWTQLTSSQGGLDAQVGDVLVHSANLYGGDGGSPGNENGPANVTWTSAISGFATISGDLWAPRDVGRLNDYELILNPGSGETILTSGTIPEDGSNSSSDPITFSFSNESIFVGEVVELLVTSDTTSQYGDYAGVNLTITQVPEPASLPIVALVVGGLYVFSSRRYRLIR
jgi:hypothetical protein